MTDTLPGARRWVPVLGALALAALFFKLPETPNVFGVLGCKTCHSADPYLPLAGTAYFSLLLAVSLLFPSFPGPLTARAGMVWAVLLAAALTWVNLPGWCAACLIGHACNVAIWAIWLTTTPPHAEPASTFNERLCLAVFAPVAVVALFSCLNLTFLAYGYRAPQLAAASVSPGDPAPSFTLTTAAGRAVTPADGPLALNFVSPGCHYCEQQLPLVEQAVKALGGGAGRVVVVSPEVTAAMRTKAPSAEWAADPQGVLRGLFGIGGYPTLVLIGGDGKVAQVIPGVPDTLPDTLPETLRTALAPAR